MFCGLNGDFGELRIMEKGEESSWRKNLGQVGVCDEIELWGWGCVHVCSFVYVYVCGYTSRNAGEECTGITAPTYRKVAGGVEALAVGPPQGRQACHHVRSVPVLFLGAREREAGDDVLSKFTHAQEHVSLAPSPPI